MVDRYTELMNAGQRALDSLDYGRAILMFEYASNAAPYANLRATALQQKGIAQRLAADLTEAERSLIEALRIVQDLALAGRIKWDLGITLFQHASLSNDARLFEYAATQFEEGRKALAESGLHVEAAVSQSHSARAMFMSGLQDEAIVGLRQANQALSGHHNVDELDNLLWLARVSPVDRWRFAPRAFRLMTLTGKKRLRKRYFGVLLRG